MSILTLVITFLGSLFKSQRQLALENLALRQQVTMLQQSVKRPRAPVADKLFYISGMWTTGIRVAHNPTYPSPGIYPWPLQNFIGVESPGSSGIIGVCTPGVGPFRAPNQQQACPRDF